MENVGQEIERVAQKLYEACARKEVDKAEVSFYAGMAIGTLYKLQAEAARWRWARQDATLWGGAYNYGVLKPEDADMIADSNINGTPGGDA